MSYGPLMLDIGGTILLEEDKKRLAHQAVGGVILFQRNYENRQQLQQLCAELHAIKSPPLVIAVDQEGGRVQRFKEGFSRIPPMARLGEIYAHSAETALSMAESLAWLLAAELLDVGIDLSLAPVLDLHNPESQVIGDRAFHSDPKIVAQLAQAWMTGMQSTGMAVVGKHFPGHGSVRADSHTEWPVDKRSFEQIKNQDLQSFTLSLQQPMQGIMMAHVLYQQCDSSAAGFSSFWIQQILRQTLGFEGLVLSDDLSMQGASRAGGIEGRIQQSLAAGCDILLLCNNPHSADQALNYLNQTGFNTPDWGSLRARPQPQTPWCKTPRWQKAKAVLNHPNLQNPKNTPASNSV